MERKNVTDIFDVCTKSEKIQSIKKYEKSPDKKIIEEIIKFLDDDDIQVRGEAFSTLTLNTNDIKQFLIKSLNDPKKNIRAFTALILANRNDVTAADNIRSLTLDESSMVRSCALGALGFMKINNAKKEIHDCFFDTNLEVRKSALKAALDIGEIISENERKNLEIVKDDQIDFLLNKIK